MASGEAAAATRHKMAVQQAHEMGRLYAPTLGEVHIYTHSHVMPTINVHSECVQSQCKVCQTPPLELP